MYKYVVLIESSMDAIYLFLLVVSLSLQVNSSPNARPDPKKNVLVFGGNGFMGASTVERLLGANYSVVTVNRGNWYWDSNTRVMPYVTHLKCDRMQSLQKCSPLQLYLWNVDSPSYFDAVIDFSAYHAFEISETLQLLHGKIMKYIYISTDSVYEVCSKNHTGPTREEDAIRPVSKSDQELLKEKDNYGHRKLECEELLDSQSREHDGVPFVTLRLPDVVGPRDNTYRWWLYQLWIKLNDYLDRALSVPHRLWNQPVSFVYVDDVADVILDLIDSDLDIFNQAYNLACDEQPTLVHFLHMLMDELDEEDIQIKVDHTDEEFHLFPSVNSGPLDTGKAKQVLGWAPSSWFDVIGTTVSFYEDAMINKKFEAPRKDVIRTLQEHFVKDPIKVLHGLKEKYELAFEYFRDEL